MGRIIKLKGITTMSEEAIRRAKKRAKKKYEDYLKKTGHREYDLLTTDNTTKV